MFTTIEEDFAEQFSEIIEEAGTIISCIMIMLTVLSFVAFLIAICVSIYSVIKICNKHRNKKVM